MNHKDNLITTLIDSDSFHLDCLNIVVGGSTKQAECQLKMVVRRWKMLFRTVKILQSDRNRMAELELIDKETDKAVIFKRLLENRLEVLRLMEEYRTEQL